MTSVAEVKDLIRRRKGTGVSQGDDGKRLNYNRNSSQTVTAQDDEPPISDGTIRGNYNLATPDDTRGLSYASEVNGQRLQDVYSGGLHTGEAPGRIPHFWNDRRSGKLGRGVTGNPVGDDSLTLDITGTPGGGLGDALFIPHQVVPRGMVMARAHLRTIDDGATVPAVYVSDPTRR